MTTTAQDVATCQALAAQCVIAANQAAEAAAYIKSANPAPLNSPAFTGTPTAPTAPQNTNSTQIATTAYLDRLMGTAGGIPTLDGSGYIPTSQLPPAVLGGLAFQGVWNANTNTPTIVSSTGTNGYFYIVQVSGTTTINGVSSWAVGDWIVFQDGGVNAWEKISPVYTTVTGIALASLATQAADTFVANGTGSTASPTAISVTAATALLNAMVGDSGSGGTKGMVPAPGSGTYAAGKYLDAGGNWSVPPGTGVSMGVLASYALLASPNFSGTPTAITQAVDTNSTALATCAFVLAQAASANPIIDGTAAPGSSTRYARADHVHPTDTSRAAVNSPTLTGTPAAPTPVTNVNTTQIPTCAWVNTYFATLANPTFTGTPAAPTASPGTNTTQIATTQFVTTAVAVGSAGLLISEVAYSSSQTITIPAGATKARIRMWGASGSGGSSSYALSSAGAGAGFLTKYVTGLTPGNTFTYTQGVGGTGVTVGNNGNAGTTTTLTSASPNFTLNAYGGAGGLSNNTFTFAPSAPGNAAGGDINITGQSGGSGTIDGNAPQLFPAVGGMTGGGMGHGSDSKIDGSSTLAGTNGGLLIDWST